VIGIDPNAGKRNPRARAWRIRARNRLLALSIVAALAAPATAAAAGPTPAASPADAQYSPSSQHGGGGATPSVGGSLPFTGFDAGLLAAIGVGLVAAGGVLRWRHRTSEERA
jgi:hypothetical protein